MVFINSFMFKFDLLLSGFILADYMVFLAFPHISFMSHDPCHMNHVISSNFPGMYNILSICPILFIPSLNLQQI